VKSVTIADGSSIHSTHVSNKVCTQADLSRDLLLNRVLLVLLQKHMLLSVPTITNSTIEVTFTNDSVEFKQGEGSVAKGKCRERIYELALENYRTTCLLPKTEEWCLKLGHPLPGKISKMPTIYPGMDLKIKSNYRCQACLKGKFRRHPFKSIAREKEKLDCLAINVCGLFAEVVLDESRYILVMVECF
jgi:hypothetical protein